MERIYAWHSIQNNDKPDLNGLNEISTTISNDISCFVWKN